MLLPGALGHEQAPIRKPAHAVVVQHEIESRVHGLQVIVVQKGERDITRIAYHVDRRAREERRNLFDDTLFMYTSEQGSGFPFAKWTCYEAGLHVGLVARWPGVITPGSVADAMVHYVDVTPTCIEAAGGELASGLDGRSFLPVLRGETDRHRDVVYGVHTTRGIINGTRPASAST